ncbi:hypothetical protein M501DRAFT_1045790, partial [Patellaria atrata CBS 101060]
TLGPQLVVGNNSFVAKIFDPHYYDSIDKYDSYCRIDCVADAGEEYTREAAAYMELSANSLCGKGVLQYYGSWTCDMPTETTSGLWMRPVLMVLMECVNGIYMTEIHPEKLSKKGRLSILYRALEANTEVQKHGVNQRDFHLRNFMCEGKDKTRGYE